MLRNRDMSPPAYSMGKSKRCVQTATKKEREMANVSPCTYGPDDQAKALTAHKPKQVAYSMR